MEHYINAFSLGGTKTLPELYEAAGLKFDFSGEYIKKLMGFLQSELENLLTKQLSKNTLKMVYIDSCRYDSSLIFA